jgi:CRP/FNR family transcriptional regulator
MMQLLSTDLKDAERRLTYWTQRPVRERLAETLLLLQKSYGKNDAGHLNITLRREDLANLLGTATETLIRALNELKREQLIHIERKNIAVLDEKRLLHLANVH